MTFDFIYNQYDDGLKLYSVL